MKQSRKRREAKSTLGSAVIKAMRSFIKSIGSQMNQKQPSHYDMLSVASVISKGSKVLAPTNANEQNEKPLPKQSKFQMSHFEDS